MGDLSFLADFMIPVIVGICLCVGYVVKNGLRMWIINTFRQSVQSLE